MPASRTITFSWNSQRPGARVDRLAVAPDCGMKYLPREIAFAKMQPLADGAAIVRWELGGG
jgi:5-methyltetrahydropteroyltriglutamate--homocysteine methyltransferase